MDEGGLRNNYVFTLVKLVLFLILFCFLVELTKELWQELRTKESFNLNILVVSILSSFAFCTFFTDLNDYYRHIQKFFFRSQFFALLFPSVLIILAMGYFFLPKAMNVTYNKNVFIFLGGVAFTTHLTLIARETRGRNFTTFVNYLFILSILYILNLILLGTYFRIGFNVHMGKVIVAGIKDGAGLIQNTFSQALR